MADSQFFLNDSSLGWSSDVGTTWTVWYIGDREIARGILNQLELLSNNWSMVEVKSIFTRLPNRWAIVAISDSCIIAATDCVRSYPLFYSGSGLPTYVSNSARALSSQLPKVCALPETSLEFRMAGYVTGGETILSDLYQLQAGELLVKLKNHSNALVYRYYRYLPKPQCGHSLVDWVDELGVQTENIFRRLIENANGRQILVPLSGGLDSRLIVCMLRYLKYDNVRTFSYGPHANYEAKIAKRVAQKVGYAWDFLPITHKGFRGYFRSPARKKYWVFSDGLSTIPNMQDIYPLMMLQRKGISWDAIVVNGQSGDFISGGHMPACLLDDNRRRAVRDILLQNHFSLRQSLKTEANMAVVAERLGHSLNSMEAYSEEPLSAAALYESWEWQERQCKYVIGGQRIYDWLDMDWRLPLWEPEYLDFWSKVPLELKMHQRLYREYLRAYDYCGLFKNFNPTVWRWPGAAMAVLPTAQLVGFFGGRAAKDSFYTHTRYIGHYGPFYAPWGLPGFLRQATDIRNPVTFFVDHWFEENKI